MKDKLEQDMGYVEQFTPEKISHARAIFAVEVHRCGKCQKDMIAKPNAGTFPSTVDNTLEAQAARGGFVIQSGIMVDGQHLCTACKDKGFADFLCALCDKRKPVSKQQESFGDPAEHLCSDCYETVSAKVWVEKVEELEDEHMYDFV